MIDLAKLQARINEDMDLRTRFIADPGKTLEAEGLHISPDMQASLSARIKATIGDEPEVPGSIQSGRAGGRPPRPFGLL